MSCIVLIRFQPQDGKRDGLLDFLRGVQPAAIEAGCKSIALNTHDDSDDVWEVEHWEDRSGHEKFVEGAAAAGAFKPLDDLLSAPFEVSYVTTVKQTKA
jgi:quinol monooxygenase YgiN